MPEFTNPGVYIQEPSNFPPSVAQVETAIPAFIGYTEKAVLKNEGDLLNKPFRVSSFSEYQQYFGQADQEKGIMVEVDTKSKPMSLVAQNMDPSPYLMYYSLQAFFVNGGGPCYIVSVGDYAGRAVAKEALLGGLSAVEKVNEVTLLVFSDGIHMAAAADYYAVIDESLRQCSKLRDRFTICDVYMHRHSSVDDIDFFRKTIAGNVTDLKYGAAYYPYLEMLLRYQYKDEDVKVIVDGKATTLLALQDKNYPLFDAAQKKLNGLCVTLPPSAAIAGVYTLVDGSRGVWKAPANVSVSSAIKPVEKITDAEQGTMNVDVATGKSVNAIRSFIGHAPAMVWGARTLAGNDNEWRYISVQRFAIMVEKSVKQAIYPFVFEPNNAGTWGNIKAMINNFLQQLWNAGALAGSTPREAFFVKVGLNESMTTQDILDGYLHVEIGMALVRPAEFVFLRLSQKMQQ